MTPRALAMSSTRSSSDPRFSNSVRAFAWVLILLVGGAGPSGRPASTPAADEPKTHVLYLGADFSVSWQGESRPVVGVRREEFVLDVDGREVAVPGESANRQIRMDTVLKLAGLSAEVTRLKGEPGYTPENNPHRGSEQAMTMAQDASAASDVSLGQLRNLQIDATWARADGTVNPDLKGKLDEAQQNYTDSLHAQNATARATEGLVQAHPAGARHDAFILSCDFSAPRGLSRPYAIVVVHYLEQPGNPKTARVAVFPQALLRVDERPWRLRFFRGGLPPGYQLERFSVHLYDGGREVPTTVSSRRIDLTTADAFQYQLVNHLSDPERENLPAPMPARDFWPADLPARLAAENRNRILFVQVDKDGRAVGAFHDKEGTLRITDADVVSLLPELRFLPALKKGKPVPGLCQVSLGEQPL